MVTEEQIKQSIDAEWRISKVRYYSILSGAIWVFLTAFLLISVSLDGLTARDLKSVLPIIGIAFVVCAVIFTPLIVTNLNAYRALIRNVGNYRVYPVILSHASTSVLAGGAINFSVVFLTEDGTVIRRDTPPLWSCSSSAKYPLKEYDQQLVCIAYDKTGDRMVILGKSGHCWNFSAN